MSIFTAIKEKIFGISKANAATTLAQPETASASSQGPIIEVDVTDILDELKSKTKEELRWRTSIVDLLKLLSLDSSLESRKELAKELKYEGNMSDSASMNIWLHKQVMTKLAQNGGVVPEELKH
jgi:hypothetical protein